MEELKIKKDDLFKALATLEEGITLMKEPKYQEILNSMRDSVIQRFEYTTDTFWKFIKLFMKSKLSLRINVNIPKEILRESINVSLISQEEYIILLAAIADRNLTSHSYDNKTADEIVLHVPAYYNCMKEIATRLKL